MARGWKNIKQKKIVLQVFCIFFLVYMLWRSFRLHVVPKIFYSLSKCNMTSHCQSISTIWTLKSLETRITGRSYFIKKQLFKTKANVVFLNHSVILIPQFKNQVNKQLYITKRIYIKLKLNMDQIEKFPQPKEM